MKTKILNPKAPFASVYSVVKKVFLSLSVLSVLSVVQPAFAQTGSLEVDGKLKVNQDLRVNGASFLWNNTLKLGHLNAPNDEASAFDVVIEDGGAATMTIRTNRGGANFVWSHPGQGVWHKEMMLTTDGQLSLYPYKTHLDTVAADPVITLNPNGTGSILINGKKVLTEESGRTIGSGNIATGNNAIALGELNQATEGGSTAIGYQNQATSGFATALGWANKSNGYCSFTAGFFNTTSGESSIALGRENSATGDRSFAAGEGSVASGWRAIAMGNGNISSGQASVAMGQGNTASNLGAVAIGSGAKASGYISFANGNASKALGDYSIALGTVTTASGTGSFVAGRESEATKENGVALGYLARSKGLGATAIGGSIANGEYSIGIGSYSTADGNFSTAIGVGSTSKGVNSVATGFASLAEGVDSLSLGLATTAKTRAQVVLGCNNLPIGDPSITERNPTDTLFILGNGHPSYGPEKSNALTVKWNGDTTVYGNLESTKKITAQDITATGKVIVQPQGDLSMGEFTAGGQ